MSSIIKHLKQNTNIGHAPLNWFYNPLKGQELQFVKYRLENLGVWKLDSKETHQHLNLI